MKTRRKSSRSTCKILVALLAGSFVLVQVPVHAQPPEEPVVARVEMKLVDGDNVTNVIEKGDLLTLLQVRENDYVVMTHDGVKGAVDKVNAVKVAESADIYTELIKGSPKEGRLYTLRASSWWALGQPEKAAADFDKAIELGYQEAHAYASRGLFYASQGEVEKAIADYERALEIDPKDLSPLINRAAVYMNQGAYDKALADYTKAHEAQPEDNALLHQRAIAFKAAGKLDEALEDYALALKSKPGDFAAIMGAGYVNFQKRDYAQAVEFFAQAIKLKPEDPVAHNNLGYNLFQLGKAKEALVAYDEAIRLQPKYGLALQNRAWLLATGPDLEVRDPESAVESAKAACELSSFANISDLSALAAALAAAGKFDEAVGWQEKVVEQVGENYKVFAQRMLKRYQEEKTFTSHPEAAEAKEKAEAETAAKEAASKEAASKEAASKEAGDGDEETDDKTPVAE